MSWQFDGGADTYALCDVGNVPQGGAAISTWWMIRPTSSEVGIYVALAGATNVLGLLAFGGETFTVNDGTGGPTLVANEWQIIGYDDNNAGGGTVRWHHCTDLDGTPTWAHSDGTAGGDRNDTATSLRLGIGPDGNPFRMKGHIAAGAIASGRLGDAGFEALGVTDMAAWVAAADAAWQCNVAVGSTALVDLTGGGADQTSLTGTPVLDSGTEPPNWTYFSGVNSGELVATLPQLAGALAGIAAASAAVDGQLPALAGILAGAWSATGVLVGTLPQLAGAFTESQPVAGRGAVVQRSTGTATLARTGTAALARTGSVTVR